MGGAEGERSLDGTGHTPHISIRGLTHAYGKGDAGVTALRDIDLDIGEGEFVSIIGPSGCGKTTLLRIVGGLVTPTRGSVRIDGGSPDEARRRQAFGAVFQDAALLPWRTAAENVGLSIELRGVGGVDLPSPQPSPTTGEGATERSRMTGEGVAGRSLKNGEINELL